MMRFSWLLMGIALVAPTNLQAQTTHHQGAHLAGDIATVVIEGIGDTITSAKGVGDVNDDGLADIVFVDASDPTNNLGQMYFVYTDPDWLDGPTSYFGLVDVNGAVGGDDSIEGFRFRAEMPIAPMPIHDNGFDAWPVGDVNGDGIDDVAIGKPGESAGVNDPVDPRFDIANPLLTGGHAYVIFGGNHETNPNVVMSPDVGDSVPGARYYAPGCDFSFGSQIDSIGDLNDDGISELIITSQYSDLIRKPGVHPVTGIPFKQNAFDDTGMIHIAFGSNSLLPLNNGVEIGPSISGITIMGDDACGIYSAPCGPAGDGEPGDYFGSSLAVGDINGDGIEDLLVGASQFVTDTGVSSGGKVYLIDGQQLRDYVQTPNASMMVSVTDIETATFDAMAPGQNSIIGTDLAFLGDVDGDGCGDFTLQGNLIFGRLDDPISGPVLSGTIDIDEIGVSIPSVSVAAHSKSAGDVNGDGLADFIGSGVLFYGRLDGGLIGQSYLSMEDTVLSPAGDLNGDGLDDLIGVNNASDESYVILGQRKLAGDLNDDGVVDSDDLDIVVNNFFASVRPGKWHLGDPTGDGIVNNLDYNEVANNMTNGSRPIPEPCSGILAAMVGIVILSMRCPVNRTHTD